MLDSKVIFKSIIGPDDNFQGELLAWKGLSKRIAGKPYKASDKSVSHEKVTIHGLPNANKKPDIDDFPSKCD